MSTPTTRIPHATAAYLAKQILAATNGGPDAKVPKVITTLHGTDITLLGSDPSYSETVAFSIDQSDGVTAVSESLRRDTYQALPIKRDIRVIPNFLECDEHRRRDLPELRARLCPPSKYDKLIIHLSNFRPVKRVDAVVEIFERVRKEVRAKLILVGEGPELGRAMRRVHELGLACDVEALGEQDQVVPLLSVSDLFLLPSAQESFGLAALEAMACEVPVVASRVGGLPEVVEDGVSGFLRDLNDIDGMAESAVALLTDPALHEPVREGRARAGADGTSAPAVSCRSMRRIIRRSRRLNRMKTYHARLIVGSISWALWVRPKPDLRTSGRSGPLASAPLRSYGFGRSISKMVRWRLGWFSGSSKRPRVFMQATAHPDDETNALHVLLNRGQGVRTILATATRGDGGQNEIGPELFDPLAVLRTEELAAVHRFDGTEQYFTRAVDFGYSFSVEETFEKWGRDEIIGDYVRLIRMTRPDVIVGMNPTGTGGGQHHQASGLLSREAFLAAADPARYPEQIKEGLRAWRAKKFYYTSGFRPSPEARLTTIDTSGYDTILGRTYAELGTEARSMHKCQAISQLLGLPGLSQVRVQLVDSHVSVASGTEDSLFSGIDGSLAGLAQYVDGTPPPSLVSGLQIIADAVADAEKRFASGGVFEASQPIVAGLTGVRRLRAQLPTLGLTDRALYDIDARLKTKEDQFVQAVRLAHGIRFEALADDGLVVPSQGVGITVLGSNRSPHAVTVDVVRFEGFSSTASCPATALALGAVFRCDGKVNIPSDAKPTTPYWHRPGTAGRYVFDADAPFGLPFRPTPFRVRAGLTVSGTSIDVDLPVQYRYANQIDGEKRMELSVVPSLSLKMTSAIAVVPAGPSKPIPRELRVIVTNHSKGELSGQVALTMPEGWRATPRAEALNFHREDEAQTVRFSIQPDAGTRRGDYEIRAVATVGQATFDKGYQVVEYPHIRRRQLETPSVARVKFMDVRTAPDLRVGYVMGSGDEVPQAVQQLGPAVELLDADRLAWGDLSRFNAIIVGVRAYDSRVDLQANHKRVLEYAAQGGIVVVQYSREDEWVQYAPLRRESDEHARDG